MTDTPTDGTPTDGTPTDGTPTDGTPTDGTPTGEPATNDTPTGTEGMEPVDVVDAPVDYTGAVRLAVLAAMKDRMRSNRLSDPDDPGHVDDMLGEPEHALYVIDDGNDRCMIGRAVGRSPDGCVFCLVARVGNYQYEQLKDGDLPLDEAYSDDGDISLCGVVAHGGVVENIFLVEHYRHVERVPAEYLPSGPFLEFVDDPSDEED